MAVHTKDMLRHAAPRPSEDLDGFRKILKRGFNFSAGNTTEWSFEDWEHAVRAPLLRSRALRERR